MDNNRVVLCGRMAVPVYSHTIGGKNFYTSVISVSRKSGVVDEVPLSLLEKFKDVDTSKKVYIAGQFRSYNREQSGRSKLILAVYVLDIEIVPDSIEDENQIEVCGYLCKPSVYRKTPLGREVADLILAVNSEYTKSSYLPCLVWGRTAFMSDKILEVGHHLSLRGRIQSRKYNKVNEEGELEERMAYEVSVKEMKILGG